MPCWNNRNKRVLADRSEIGYSIRLSALLPDLTRAFNRNRSTSIEIGRRRTLNNASSDVWHSWLLIPLDVKSQARVTHVHICICALARQETAAATANEASLSQTIAQFHFHCIHTLHTPTYTPTAANAAMAPASAHEKGVEVGAAPSPPAFSVLHDKALPVERVTLCPKMDLAAVLMADGALVAPSQLNAIDSVVDR